MKKNLIQSPGSKIDNKQLAKSFQGFFLPRSIIAQAIIMGYEFLINAASIPCKLIMRRDMGERIFSPFAFILMLVGYITLAFQYFLYAYAAVWNDFLGLRMFSGGVETSQLLYFILCYVSNPIFIVFFLLINKGVKHFKEKIREAQENIYQYSYRRGESIYFEKRKGTIFGFELNDINKRMLLEPWVVFRIAFPIFLLVSVHAFLVAQDMLVGFDSVIVNSTIVGLGSIGLSFSISSFCLFLEEFSIVMRTRAEAMDLYDSEIYAQQIAQQREEFVNRNNDEQKEDQQFIAE